MSSTIDVAQPHSLLHAIKRATDMPSLTKSDEYWRCQLSSKAGKRLRVASGLSMGSVEAAIV